MKKISFVFLILPFIIFAQDNWTLKKEVDNIKIYTRNSQGSNLKEFKAITMINSPLKNILTELLDAPDYYEDCKPNISYYVKELNENQHVFYAHKDLPWPVRDRDIVTLLTVNRIDSDNVKLTLESLPEELPSKNKNH